MILGLTVCTWQEINMAAPGLAPSPPSVPARTLPSLLTRVTILQLNQAITPHYKRAGHIKCKTHNLILSMRLFIIVISIKAKYVYFQAYEPTILIEPNTFISGEGCQQFVSSISFKLILNQTSTFQSLLKTLHPYLFMFIISHFAEQKNAEDPKRVGICPEV